MTTLFDVSSNGYKDKKKKSKNLGGYVMDEQLSNKHYQTYYDPKDKKLLFNSTGTRQTAGDWLNNINLGLGIGFKESKRYKEAHHALREAKKNIMLKMQQSLDTVKEDLSQITSQVKAIIL